MLRLTTTLAATVAVATLHVGLAAGSSATAAPVKFKNCAQLNAKYPHGVGLPGAKDHVSSAREIPVRNFTVNSAVYNDNKALLDRDKDNIACEKH